jgi:hypothetical protein
LAALVIVSVPVMTVDATTELANAAKAKRVRRNRIMRK